MKIWFDLSNSPHVILFYDLIKHLEHDGHEVVITSRPLANTIALLDQYGLDHTPVGIHYGKRFFYKLLGYPIRVYQLYSFLRKQKPNLAVSQSSFHSPLVAFLLRIPSLYTNDNEHALGNIPAFLFASRVLVPQDMSIPCFFKIKYFSNKIIRYPGIKEGIYLWRRANDIRQRRSNYFAERKKVFIRPEPTTAQYYTGKHNFLDELIASIQEKYEVIVLARDIQQQRYYSLHSTLKVHVPIEPMAFDQIAVQCLVFIGAGGSMTRELATAGIPTISVYQSELLQVDRYLIDRGLLIHDPDLTADSLQLHMDTLQSYKQNDVLMKEGKLAYNLFISTIFSLYPAPFYQKNSKVFQISKI